MQSEKNSTLHKTPQKTNTIVLPAKNGRAEYWSPFIKVVINRLAAHKFGDSGRRAIYCQGFGEKGHLFSGIWGESITFWSFREQGAGG